MAKVWGSWWSAERQERGRGRLAPHALLTPACCHPAPAHLHPRGDGACWILASASSGPRKASLGHLPCAILMLTTGQVPLFR